MLRFTISISVANLNARFLTAAHRGDDAHKAIGYSYSLRKKRATDYPRSSTARR